jgi:hypothetical protein
MLGFRSVLVLAAVVLPSVLFTGRNSASPGKSPTAAVAPPSDGSAKARLRIAVVSDLNDAYGSTTYSSEVHAATRAMIDRIRPDLVLITGDMVAGQMPNLRYSAMWKGFHSAVTEPLRSAGIPVAPAPGNHDASGYPQFANERAEYAKQWTEPNHVPAVSFVDRTHYPFRYSFGHRGAFFVALDATRGGPIPASDRSWVEQQLGGASQTIKLGYGHLPLHPVAHGRLGEVLGDSKLESVFADRGLTAYLSGHHHAYYPGVAAGIRQVAMPCLGGGQRVLVGTGRASKKALVVIDVADDVIERIDALEAPLFETAVDRSTLPKRIVHGRHVLTRDDLAAP